MSDTHDQLGQRVMTRLGTAGLLTLLLGLGLPWFFSTWESFAADPSAAPAPPNDAPGIIRTAVLVAGIGLLMLTALAGMALGPFSRFQQKYGTLAALVAFAAPLLLFAATLTMALR